MAQYSVPISGPNGSGSGTIVVNASDPGAAVENATQGGNTPTGTASLITTSTTGNNPGNNNNNNNSNQGNGLDQLLAARAAGDTRAFNELVREFDLRFGFDKDKFAEDIRQYNQNFGITQAGVTGYYQAPGATHTGNIAIDAYNAASPATQAQYLAAAGGNAATAAGQYWNDISPSVNQSGMTPDQWVYGVGATNQGRPTMAREQQTYAQQMGMIAQAAALQANPFRQQQAIGQMGNLLGGQGVAGFSAPNTVQGVGTAGGNTQGGMGYLQQMIDDIKSPAANQTSMNNVLAGIPTPNKLNSNEFLRASPSTQSMVLQGMQEKYGIDPNDALTQIKATLPQFQAPTTVGTVKR